MQDQQLEMKRLASTQTTIPSFRRRCAHLLDNTVMLYYEVQNASMARLPIHKGTLSISSQQLPHRLTLDK